MKLRRKTVIIVGMTITILIGSLFLAAQSISSQSVSNTENKETRQDVERLQSVLSQEISDLNATALDYAAWDDTYTFIQDHNINYVNANMMDATFVNLRLSTMVFFNSSSQIVYGKAFSLINATEMPLPSSFKERLGNDSLLQHSSPESSLAGLVLLPEGPMLIASRPILTSERQGPIRGTLSIGRFLDSAEITYLNQVTHRPIVVQTVDSREMPSDFLKANSSLSKESSIFVQPLTEKTIAGYALIEDIYGNPSLVLRVEAPRDLYAQAQASILYLVLSLALVGVTFGGLTVMLLEKFVLSRLSKLTKNVAQISETHNFAARVSISGKDELSGLAREINGMLEELTHAEETTRQSDTRLRQVTENMTDVVGLTDVNGVYKYVSPSVRRTLGYEPSDLLGKSVFDLMHPDDIDKARKTVQDSIKTLVRGRIEARCKHVDGHYVWMEGAGDFIVDENGEPVGTVFSLRDTTERKQIESKLKDSEERLSSLIELAPDAIYVNDLEGTFTDGNKQAENVTGYAKEELVGKNFFTAGLLPEKYVPKAIEMLQKNASGQKAGPEEFELTRKDGSTITVEISAIPVERGGKVEILGIARDITERRKIENALRDNEEKYRLLFDNVNDVVFSYDNEFKLSNVSPSVEKALGYRPEELVGKPVQELGLMAPESMEIALANAMQALSGKRVGSIAYEFIKKDGSRAFGEVNSSPLIRDGKVAGVIAVARDITERKEMEDRIKESEEKFRGITERSFDIIVTVDLDGVITYISPALEKITPYRTADLLGKPFQNLFATSKLPNVLEVFSEISQGKSVQGLEVETLRKDGSSGLFEVNVSPIMVEGKIVGIQAIARDITERKRIENRLEQTNKKLQTLLQTAREGIITADPLDNLTFANKAFADILGYTEEELFNLNLRKLLDEQGLRRIVEETESRKTGKVSRYELVLYPKDKKPRIVQVTASPLWNEDGSFAGSMGIMMDVTEHKKIEEALRESEEKMRNILQSSPDAISATDLTGNIVDCNQATLAITGYSTKTDLIGKNVITFVAERDRKRVKQDILRTAEQDWMKDVEYTFLKKNGSEYPVEVSASVVRDASGEPKYFVAIFKDITERKEMQRKLEEYSQQLENLVEKRTRQLREAQEQLIRSERLAAIGQVAAMVGHDLRNPLTGIKGAAYYLRTKLGPAADHNIVEMVELIEKDVQYSNKIITDLLDYSREIRLELTETTPMVIVSESLSLIGIPKNVQALNLTQNEPKIKIDSEKMKRVFANLVKNAVDAMPNGGKLTITSRKIDARVEITFADNGQGMTQEVMQKIWTPFFTTKAKGMGLGLPVCKRIVEAHKGSISVNSKVNKGTTFTITIPIEPQLQGGEKIWVNVPESLSSTTTKA